VAGITAPEVLSVLRRVESRGAIETAHRAKENISMVMRYAIATGRAERDPCPDLKGALTPYKHKHHAALTDPADVAELLRAIDNFKGTFPVKCALRLSLMLFPRPGELRRARWQDFDLDRAEWRHYVTKIKQWHIVPLAPQAVQILRALQPLTGQREYVFPGRDPKLPMSSSTVLAALARLGYSTKTEMSGHGVRALARTMLAERLHFDPQVIERQLSHKTNEELGEAYDRTQYLEDRRRMMAVWADYLDKLQAGAEVIPIRPAA
jgi:integrase